MKKILCPTDFSDAATSGVMYAAKFAKATGSTLTLYHVHSLFDLSTLELVGGREASFKSIGDQLEKQSRDVSRIFKISCYAETELSVSSLSNVLLDKENEYDLIIMGSGSFDDLRHFFTGSNTYKTIRNGNIPLIIVTEGCVYCPVDRVVYAYNYLEEKEVPMEQLTPWILPLCSNLTVMEVHAPQREDTDDAEYFRVRKLVKLLNPQLPIEFDELTSADIADGIHNYMLKKQADMLVLAAPHRNFVAEFFHRSVIRSVTNKATYPVFIVHE
jgi:nucleotide-binding universal stress UspA family protein